jgi:4-hydroxybenzoate polyprenyltransferase
MNSTVIPTPASKFSLLRYLSCLRVQDILVLQGTPVLGAALAIHHPGTAQVGPLMLLLTGNLLLMTHVFMLNDWAGLTADRRDPNKAAAVFTARGVGRREISALAAFFLVSSLVVFSRLGVTALALALAIATLSALYSLPRFDWKAKPFLNSGAHLAGGILHFLLGYSLAGAIDLRGVAIATFFALIFAAGHLTQEIRDYHGDAANDIRTNAVSFGRHRTFAASMILFTLAQLLLFVLALESVLPRPLAALFVLYPLQLHWSLETLRNGLTYSSVTRLQTRYRALYAVIGVAMVTALVLTR